MSDPEQNASNDPKAKAGFAPSKGSAANVAGESNVAPCWCGETNPYYAPLPNRCGGSGYMDCLCGGDFCVCHNHGEVECFGCPDCREDDFED